MDTFARTGIVENRRGSGRCPTVGTLRTVEPAEIREMKKKKKKILEGLPSIVLSFHLQLCFQFSVLGGLTSINHPERPGVGEILEFLDEGIFPIDE